MKAKSARIARRLQNRRGAILVIVSLAMVSMLGMLALTIDLGAGRRERRIAQTAADAAAIGGGQQIVRGNAGTIAVYNSAVNSLQLNGFTAADATINYINGPVSGDHIGNKKFVEVIINKTIPTIFGSIFNSASLNIRVRAVAGVGDVAGLSCVYALGTTGIPLNIPGDLITNCGVQSNAGVDVRKLFAPVVSAVGTINAGGTANVQNENIPPFADPLAGLPVPAEGSPVCTASKTDVVIPKNTTVALTAGDYCGGITFQDGGTVTLGAGTYVLRGGGINANVNNARLTGTNVTIINTNGPGNDQSKFAPIVFGNSCYVGLTAPTTGTYKGIVIFADPAGPPDLVNTLCGVGEKKPDPDIIGTMYFPNQTLKLENSNGKFILEGSIVAKTLLGQNGGGTIEIQSIPTSWAAILRLTLVE